MRREMTHYISPGRKYKKKKKRNHHLMHKKRKYKSKPWWGTHG